MKKNLFFAAFMFLSVAALAQGSPKNALKLNPLSLMIKTGNLSYERSINRNQSVQLGIFYSGAGIGDLKYEGYGLLPEYRFYFGGKGRRLNGGYLAPFGRYQQFTVSDGATKKEAGFTSIGGGATLGYQRAWNSGLALNLFAGPSYNKLRLDDENEGDPFDFKGGVNGFGLRTGISVGFTF